VSAKEICFLCRAKIGRLVVYDTKRPIYFVEIAFFSHAFPHHFGAVRKYGDRARFEVKKMGEIKKVGVFFEFFWKCFYL